MNKWSRNSIYGAGLASLLYLGCGNSVQNIDTKVQEDTDLSLADKNLDDFYQPTDSSLEDRINLIDLRELDYISIEDSSSEIQRESDILPDSLEYGSDQNPVGDDYSIDLGSDHVNGDAGLDGYVSNDLDYCNSLEINSSEWCENCNTPPNLIYTLDPELDDGKITLDQFGFANSYADISQTYDIDNNLKECFVHTTVGFITDCNQYIGIQFYGSPGDIVTLIIGASDRCNAVTTSPEYEILLE